MELGVRRVVAGLNVGAGGEGRESGPSIDGIGVHACPGNPVAHTHLPTACREAVHRFLVSS